MIYLKQWLKLKCILDWYICTLTKGTLVYLTKGAMEVFKLIKCGFTSGFSLALVMPSMRSLRPTKHAQCQQQKYTKLKKE